jgi:uncharacterized damage-inducible protein DinB
MTRLRVRRSLAVAAAACLTLAAPAAAQNHNDAAVDPMAATVTQYFSMIERQFVGLADAMPADRYAFAPTTGEFKGVRTFAQQVKHVACANFAFFNEVEHKTPPAACETRGPSAARTKAELMQYLRESFTYATRVMRRLTPANAMDPVEGPYGGKTTRLGVSTMAVWHATDHYGQLVVYLRMNGIVPPASAGTAP